MNRNDYNENQNIIFYRLKRLRKKKKLSQQKLALEMQLRNVNIDQQTISLIERNKRFVSDFELACISKILSVDSSELLCDFDELGKLPEE